MIYRLVLSSSLYPPIYRGSFPVDVLSVNPAKPKGGQVERPTGRTTLPHEGCGIACTEIDGVNPDTEDLIGEETRLRACGR